MVVFKSTIGFGVTVSSSILAVPLGAIRVRLLVKSPIAFTLTFTVMVAFPFAVILVITQVTLLLPITSSPTKSQLS